jgi:hypothetical protein
METVGARLLDENTALFCRIVGAVPVVGAVCRLAVTMRVSSLDWECKIQGFLDGKYRSVLVLLYWFCNTLG